MIQLIKYVFDLIFRSHSHLWYLGHATDRKLRLLEFLTMKLTGKDLR